MLSKLQMDSDCSRFVRNSLLYFFLTRFNDSTRSNMQNPVLQLTGMSRMHGGPCFRIQKDNIYAVLEAFKADRVVKTPNR